MRILQEIAPFIILGIVQFMYWFAIGAIAISVFKAVLG